MCFGHQACWYFFGQTKAALPSTLDLFLNLASCLTGTASFAITAAAFPDNVGAVFGLLETFTGLGLMVGPALGGVLFQVGGFVTPFAVLGGIMVLTVPFSMMYLPRQGGAYM